ncbi:MAG: alkaline phosphatase family protein [Solirubrobacteraceae bacterium]
MRHVLVLMMENHSFDNVLGMLPHQSAARRRVDGFRVDAAGRPRAATTDRRGRRVPLHHTTRPCDPQNNPNNSWANNHAAFHGGRNDRFAWCGHGAMGYWDRGDLPFLYSLAATFPVGNRYFQSCLGPTFPNRRFLFCGTSDGVVETDPSTFTRPARNGTIFDRLDALGIDWRVYHEGSPSPLIVPGFASPARAPRLVPFQRFLTDAARGALPGFAVLDPNYDVDSQENPQDIRLGERFVARVVTAVMRSPAWRDVALFITYDEGGGYYDHVPPPPAPVPDSTPPIDRRFGGFDRYGFRVPCVLVSPWARRGHVSSRVQDHTSILRFVEHKWNIGALTNRDARADPMLDWFDFRRASFAAPPKLSAPARLVGGTRTCAPGHAAASRAPGWRQLIARYGPAVP